MKLTVGRKSVIARNINSILWGFASFLIIRGFVRYIKYLMVKYNTGAFKIIDDYDSTAGEVFVIILGYMIIFLFSAILVTKVFDLFVGIHYFKKTKTEISRNIITQFTYRFPYSKDFKTILISDILEVGIKQSSVERAFRCGNIYIKGYSNSNYSKTNFKIYIKGLDSVTQVRENILNEFQNCLQK